MEKELPKSPQIFQQIEKLTLLEKSKRQKNNSIKSQKLSKNDFFKTKSFKNNNQTKLKIFQHHYKSNNKLNNLHHQISTPPLFNQKNIISSSKKNNILDDEKIVIPKVSSKIKNKIKIKRLSYKKRGKFAFFLKLLDIYYKC